MKAPESLVLFAVGARVTAAIALAAVVVWAWSTGRHDAGVWYWPPLVGACTALAFVACWGAWASRRAAPEPSARSARLLLTADVVAPCLFLAAGWALQGRWYAQANPDLVMLGMDHLSFVMNVESAARGWEHFNVDKPALHARLSLLFLDGTRDYVAAALVVSRASVAALPALSWALARSVYGRLAGVFAGLCVLCDAEIWIHGAETTSYALFAATVTAALAALAAHTRTLSEGRASGLSVFTAVLVGVCTGLSVATSEKAVVALLPVLVTMIVTGHFGGPGLLRRIGLPVITLGIAAAVVAGTRGPAPSTAIGNLITNQREEVHRAIPWNYDAIRHPDPAHPYPGSDLVHRFIQSSALDVTLAALVTPNDSNSMRESREGGLAEIPDTSIAPAAVVRTANLREFWLYRPMSRTRTLLFLAALVLSLGARQSRIAAILALVLISSMSSFSLKYQDRYFLHVLPLVWVITAGGLIAGARLLGGPSRVARNAGAGTAIGLLFALLVSCWTADPHGWMDPRRIRWPPTSADRVRSLGDLGVVGQSARVVADYLQERALTGKVHACNPPYIGLYLPAGWNLPPSGRDPACGALDTVPVGHVVVVSNTRENGGSGQPDPSLLRSGWKLRALAASGRLEVDPGGPYTSGALVWVFERQRASLAAPP